MIGKLVLGVTGNIASGKSTVVSILKELGAIHIDADLVYREMVQAGEPLLARLVDHFGREIIGSGGALDRRALGKIVFADPAALRSLDEITHPAIIAEIDRRVDAIAAGIVVIDAVKLIESGHAEHCDVIWVVAVDPEIQVTRLMNRNRLEEDEARRRVAAQPPMETKLTNADRVIDNSGSLAATRGQVLDAWQALPVHLGPSPVELRGTLSNG
ncbi:MAG: dephospho-CoA kinase [Thermomicrobiales bacterium]